MSEDNLLVKASMKIKMGNTTTMSTKQIKFLFFLMAFAFLACDGQETAPSKTQISKTTKKEKDDDKSFDVKDKTKAAPPKTSMPATLAKDGWSTPIKGNDKAILSGLPATNTVLYKVFKNIGGEKRGIFVVYGDLLKESDAIVNAANTSLLGGGGIDKLIHNAAKVDGEDLLYKEAKAYFELNNDLPFRTGSAMVMHPYALAPAVSMVIFTAGPQIKGSEPTEEEKIALYSAVYNSLLKADEYKAKSVSTVLISSGIFGFPKDSAAQLHIKAALQFFADNQNTEVKDVRLTNFDKPTAEAVLKAFLNIFN